MTTITMITYYIIGKVMSLGFFSFISNLFLLFLIKKNIFGSEIKNLVEDIPKNNINAIFIFIQYFIFVYILIFLVRYNLTTIYLESVNVNVVVNGVSADITGGVLATAVLGDTAVFLGSARLAYLIISKNPGLSTLSKIGIVIGSGGGGLTSYKVIDRSFNSWGLVKNELVLNGNLSLGTVNVTTTGNYNIPEHPVLSLLFGMNSGVNFNNVHQQFRVINNGGSTTLEGVNNAGVINTLDNYNPNLKSQFRNYTPTDNPYSPRTINSPYESESGLISFLIDNLTDHLYLAVISVYLLLMLLLIFICKLILSKDIEFKRISKISIFN